MRPYNYLPTQPGRGTTIVEPGGTSLGVVNLSGIVHLQAGSPPLVAVDAALREVARADQVLVDMHAEVTSEKVALGWYLDGKVTAVVGTHTHVPTADARVLPGGTAYITDVGMTGARGGVIGMKKEQSIAVMRTHMPMRYEPREDDPWLTGVLIRESAGRADTIGQALAQAADTPEVRDQDHRRDVPQRPLLARRPSPGRCRTRSARRWSRWRAVSRASRRRRGARRPSRGTRSPGGPRRAPRPPSGSAAALQTRLSASG